MGTMDTFVTYGAPANLIETVNTMGLPIYARQIARNDGSAIDVKTEASVLPVNKRPRLNCFRAFSIALSSSLAAAQWWQNTSLSRTQQWTNYLADHRDPRLGISVFDAFIDLRGVTDARLQAFAKTSRLVTSVTSPSRMGLAMPKKRSTTFEPLCRSMAA